MTKRSLSEVKLADNLSTLESLNEQLIIERLQVRAILLGALQLFERLLQPLHVHVRKRGGLQGYVLA